MIRRAAVLALLVLAACEPSPATTSVSGSTLPGGAGSDTAAQEACATARAVAERMMRARQVGVPIAEVLALARDVDDAGLRALGESVALAAYDEPVQSGAEAQARAVAAFADRVEAGCPRA